MPYRNWALYLVYGPLLPEQEALLRLNPTIPVYLCDTRERARAQVAREEHRLAQWAWEGRPPPQYSSALYQRLGPLPEGLETWQVCPEVAREPSPQPNPEKLESASRVTTSGLQHTERRASRL